MLKTQILYQNVDDQNGMRAGITAALDKLRAIKFYMTVDYKETGRQFSGLAFENSTVGKGAGVNPNEILEEASLGYRLACLIYNWDFVTAPKPTNPVMHGMTQHGCTPFQVPVNWYSDFTTTPRKTYPEVLTQYFLHELSHALHFLAGRPDLTHNQGTNPEWSNKQPIDYYLYLIEQLRPYWGVFEADTDSNYVAVTMLREGSKGPRVKQLQKDLNTLGYFKYILGFTENFWPVTKKAVMDFQRVNGLKVDGVYGPFTDKVLQECLKKKPNLSKLDAWAMAIQKFEGYYPGSRSYRNNNPGNIRFVGQSSASGKDDLGFCIFPTYQIGFNALKSLLKQAATTSKLYDHEGDLYTFFSVYAPASDNNHPRQYAEFVAKEIGVPVSTPIKNLI